MSPLEGIYHHRLLYSVIFIGACICQQIAQREPFPKIGFQEVTGEKRCTLEYKKVYTIDAESLPSILSYSVRAYTRRNSTYLVQNRRKDDLDWGKVAVKFFLHSYNELLRQARQADPKCCERFQYYDEERFEYISEENSKYGISFRLSDFLGHIEKEYLTPNNLMFVLFDPQEPNKPPTGKLLVARSQNRRTDVGGKARSYRNYLFKLTSLPPHKLENGNEEEVFFVVKLTNDHVKEDSNLNTETIQGVHQQ